MSYSQYQTYSQNASGGGSTTTVTGQQWNGTSWVALGSSVQPSTQSTYSSYGAANAPASSSYASLAAPASSTATTSQSTSLVTTYTQYYHQWHNRALEQRKLAETLVGTQKEEALRQAQWADYYADQSSRAAHHYAGTSSQASAPPPVPPAPPQAVPQAAPQAAPSRPSSKPSRWDSGPAAPPKKQTIVSPTKHDAPGGLKQYVHKSLAQCNTEEERKFVQKEVEKVIAKAIQEGTMHTMDWDNVELISLGRDEEAPVARPAKKARVEKQAQSYYGSSMNDDYYGNGGRTSDNRYDSELPENDSYYGNSSYFKNGKPKNGYNISHFKKSSPPKKGYEDKLPVNNSYYGNANYGNANAAPIVETTNVSRPSKSKNYYGPSSITDTDLGDDDFVPLHKSPRTKAPKLKYSKQAAKKLAKSDGFERSSLALAKRANRFAGKGGVSHAASIPASAGRNVQRYMGLAVIGGGTKKLDETDYEHMTVKGTCQTLAKEYLRLTAPPRAELVRPEPVLKQHLQNLKQEWGKPKGQKRDYVWFCSQFKAVRQDLTVQRINNEFAVDAYETHARIALEEGDLNEYNQCQTQLKELYDSLHCNEDALKNRNEFMAYRIIYYVFLTGNKKYQGGSSDLFKIMLSLTPEQREDPCIRHALKLRVAVAEYDYHAFFRLQDSCPKLGAYLMDFMVPNVRYWALQRICKAYRPSVPVAYVLRELGFDPDDPVQLEEGKQWLGSCGCVLSDDGKTLLSKESVVRESDLATKSSLI